MGRYRDAGAVKSTYTARLLVLPLKIQTRTSASLAREYTSSAGSKNDVMVRGLR